MSSGGSVDQVALPWNPWTASHPLYPSSRRRQYRLPSTV